MSSFAQQLKQRKQAFLADFSEGRSLENWVVSVGNEAGDLDSMASALGYAHFAAQADASSSRQYVPLVMTARSDLILRPENTEALSSAGVTDDALLTIDDLPSSKLSSLGVSFALVDHNVLLPSFRSSPETLSNQEDDRKVAAILDHHADEGLHLHASPRHLEPAGSCASLVTSYFSGLSSSSSFSTLSIPSPLADLLLSAISIDTKLRPWTEGGKATATDLSAVEHLLPFSSFSSSSSSSTSTAAGSLTASNSSALEALKHRNAYLSERKNDVAWMSGRDLLRRDYKEYVEGSLRYGLSTVPLGLNVWLEKAQGKEGGEKWDLVLSETRAWMKERGLVLAGVLTSYTHVKRKSGKEGKHRRELVLVAAEGYGEKLQGVFEGVERDEVLQLEEWKDVEYYGGRMEGTTEEGEKWKVWQQGNVKATRKQVAPVLKKLVLEAAGVAE
ncbi:hypothetical protein JCM8547_001751 [Rhodosporidiobolus lusitaniae]